MPIKYSVPTIAHPGGENLCFWDAISMVAQYKYFRETLRNPFLARILEEDKTTRPWASLLGPEIQRAITKRGRDIFHRGEAIRILKEVARELGIIDAHTPITPEGFQKALMDHGPFVYMGRIKRRDLQGGFRNHALVVTGIEKKGDQYYVSYNDPRYKLPDQKEFYGFLLEFMPFLKSPGQTTGTMILHLEEGLPRTAALPVRPGQPGWGLEVTRSRPFDWRSNRIPPSNLQTAFRPDRPGQPGWGLEVTRSRAFDWRSNRIPPSNLQATFRPDRPGQPGWGIEVTRSRSSMPKPGSWGWMAQGLR